ncbi:MAG: LapA family protein [Clostridiales bacterium]|nr:LapA family protein [Clostridiales bacterium]
MQIRFILSLILAIVVALFAVMNAAPVNVNLFFAQFKLSLAIVIFASAVFGAVIIMILGMISQAKMKLKIKELTKKNQQLAVEVSKLKEVSIIKEKEIPIVDSLLHVNQSTEN